MELVRYWLNERAVGSEDFFRSYGILLGQAGLRVGIADCPDMNLVVLVRKAVLNHIHVPNIFPRVLA